MIFNIFCVIAVLVFAAMVVTAFMDADGFLVFAGVLFGALALLVGGVVCLVLAAIGGNVHDAEPRVYQLKQLALDSNVKGNFFLGIGTVDEEKSFIYYRESGKTYVIDSVPVESTTIIEDSSTPRVEVIDEMVDTWIAPEWFGPWDTRYIIHVPEGSITTGVNINLN